MPHCCIIVEGTLLLEVYKAYHSYDPQYLSEMFKKQSDEYHTRNSKARVQHKCNSTTYGLCLGHNVGDLSDINFIFTTS